MNIQIVIQFHKSCLRNVEAIERLPNSHYDPALHYKAIDNASRYAYQMINHPDWTAELQAEHYPNGIGDIAYPVSC
jgi:hypothetical protein